MTRRGPLEYGRVEGWTWARFDAIKSAGRPVLCSGGVAAAQTRDCLDPVLRVYVIRGQRYQAYGRRPPPVMFGDSRR